MAHITLVTNDYITVEYIPEKHTIHHTIHQPIGGQPLRDALNTGTEALKENHAYKWLSDDRNNGPLSREDAEWGFNDWNRRTIDAGWKYWAIVVPQSVADAGTLIPAIESLYELGLRMMVFTDLNAAWEWLDRH